MALPKYLYRYKSLDGESFLYTLDIILNNRLYTPLAEELNDPCEGFFVGVNEFFPGLIESEKKRMARILSFSESYNNNSLWAHYTNGFRGICLEFDAQKMQDELSFESGLEQVKYRDSVPKLTLPGSKYIDKYLFKGKEWRHEKEWRLITSENNKYFYFKDHFLTSVFFGPRIDKNIEKIIIKLLKEKKSIPRIKRMGFSSKSYKMIIKQQITCRSTLNPNTF